jgi:hypothetical protein
MENYVLGCIFLLIFLIVALIIIIVLRDRRELKTKQIAEDLSQLETVVGDLKKIKDELAPALAALKKHEAALSQTITQANGHLKQTGYVGTNTGFSGANSEHRQQPAGTAGANKERQDDGRDRDRGPRQPGKGKTWGNGRPDNRRREYPGASSASAASGVSGEAGETVAINDGEKYAKVSELAAHGLPAQEIAKRLNVSAEEVSLVLELKKK